MLSLQQSSMKPSLEFFAVANKLLKDISDVD